MSEKEFQDKVVVVTGGESGIGRRCVELFLEAGAQVVVAGIDEEKLETLSSLAGGSRMTCRRVDVGSEQQMQNLFAEPMCAQGVDVLVNCAGIQRLGGVEQTTLEDWESTFRVNVTGAFLAARAAVPLMRYEAGDRS